MSTPHDDAQKDAEFERLLSRIPPKFFSRTNFNAFEYYEDDNELDQVKKTVNEAVTLIVDRCYRAFNSATSSFRHVLQTFNESQEAIRQLQGDVVEGQRILFTTNRNLKDLYHQQMTHEHILKILSKIDVLTRVPTKIASYLSRHQYFRGVTLLLYGLELLNTVELRQIGALYTLREDLLMLKQDLQRILYFELKNLIFLNDPRLRQSVLDDGSVVTTGNTAVVRGYGDASYTSVQKKNDHAFYSSMNNTHSFGGENDLFSHLGGKAAQHGGMFRFTGSTRWLEHHYKPGFGYYNRVSDGLGDSPSDSLTRSLAGAAGNNANPFDFNDSNSISSIARRNRQKKSLYSLETLGNANDDEVAIPPSMDFLKSSAFPPLIEVLTPLKSDVIYDAHDHTKTGLIATNESTSALQGYLATYGYSLGELKDEEFNEEEPSLLPFLLMCQNAIDAEGLDDISQAMQMNDSDLNDLIKQQEIQARMKQSMSLTPGGTSTSNSATTAMTMSGASSSTIMTTATSTVITDSSGNQKTLSLNLLDSPKGSQTHNIPPKSMTNFDTLSNLERPNPHSPTSSNTSDPTSPTNKTTNNGLTTMFGRTFRAPTLPEPKLGSTFHARYLYRLLALENTPTFIADPLSHPSEYLTILIETLNLLNYLPSVEQRLQRQTPDCIRQVVQREINALSTQVLQFALQSYIQSSHAWHGSQKVVNVLGKMVNTGRNGSKRGPGVAGHTTSNCSLQQNLDPTNPFSANIAQHHNVITALLPWQQTVDPFDARNETEYSRSTNSTTGKTSRFGLSGDSSEEDPINAFKTNSAQNNQDSTESTTSLTQQRRQKRKDRQKANIASRLSVWGTASAKDEKNQQAILMTVVKIIQKDPNFQATMLADILNVVCKLCVRILMTQKQATAHITALKNISSHELNNTKMTIQQYHDFMVSAYTRPDTLIAVHEISRRTYNLFQTQIQQLLWKFFEKSRIPLIFSIDDEITQQIFNNKSYDQYQSGLTRGFGGFGALSGLGGALGLGFGQQQLHLTPQQFFQNLFQANPLNMINPKAAPSAPPPQINNSSQSSTKTAEQDKEEKLKFSFANSRTQSVARQTVQAEFMPQDYEIEARQRAQKLKEQRKKQQQNILNGGKRNDADDDWYDVDDDDESFLPMSHDENNWLISNAYHVSLIYLPLIHFADVCNSIVDGIDHVPYLSPPPMYQLFPHLLQNNVTIAKAAHHQTRRYNKYLDIVNGVYLTKINAAIRPQLTPTSAAMSLLFQPDTPSSASTPRGWNTPTSVANTPKPTLPKQSQQTQQKSPSINLFLLPIVDLRTAIESRLKVEEETKRQKMAQNEANASKLVKFSKKIEDKKNTDQFSPYNLLPQHLLHLLPSIHKHTIGQVQTLLQIPGTNPQSGSVNVQPRVLGPSTINPITKTTIWVRSNIFQPYPLPSIRSLLQNTKLNTSFLHSSYPLTQCLALAIQDIFLPKLHNDMVQAIERILNSPLAFKPYENCSSTSLLGPSTSINLTQFEQDSSGNGPTHNSLTSGTASDGSTAAVSPTKSDQIDVTGREGRGSLPNVLTAVHSTISPSGTANSSMDSSTDSSNLPIITGISTTDKSLSQLYRVVIYQQASYDTNEPFRHLYHFFANLYKGTLSSQLLLEQLMHDPDWSSSTPSSQYSAQTDTVLNHQHSNPGGASASISSNKRDQFAERPLPTSITGKLSRTRRSPHFTGSKSVVMIRCAYDLSFLLEALSQDMCLLPQFSHHIMSLFQHAVDSFLERVQLKYSEVTQRLSAQTQAANNPNDANPDVSVFSTSVLQSRKNVDAMASDIWFLDYRGLSRSNKQYVQLYQNARQVMGARFGQLSSLHDSISKPLDVGTINAFNNPFASISQPQRIRSSTLIGAEKMGLTKPSALNTSVASVENSNSATTTTTAATTTTTASPLVPGNDGVFSREPDKLCQFFIETFFSSYNPALADILNPEFNISSAQLLHQSPVDLTINNTMIKIQQQMAVTESSGFVSSLFGHKDKSDKKKEKPSATSNPSSPSPKDSTNGVDSTNITASSAMALSITSRSQSAIKPLSYLALLSNSLDWLSNFLYHLPLPGIHPLTLSEAASKSSSALPSTKKQVSLESSFYSSSPGSTLSSSRSKLQRVNTSGSTPSSASFSHPQSNLGRNQSVLQESASLLNFAASQTAKTFDFNRQLTLIPLYDVGSTGMNPFTHFGQSQEQLLRFRANTNSSIIAHNIAQITGGTSTTQPLVMIPGSLHSGLYTPLLANTVPSCYQNTANNSTQAIYESIANDMTGSLSVTGAISTNATIQSFNGVDPSGGRAQNGISGSAFTTGSALSNDLSMQTSALDNATNVLRSYTTLVSMFIAPPNSTLFAANPLNKADLFDGATTTTTATGANGVTTSSTVMKKPGMSNVPGVQKAPTPAQPGTGNFNKLGGAALTNYGQFFDLSLGNGAASTNWNELIASSITQPLLQYNPLDKYQSTLALSRCLALVKMLPDAAQTRMYVCEESSLRYQDEDKWRSYLQWGAGNNVENGLLDGDTPNTSNQPGFGIAANSSSPGKKLKAKDQRDDNANQANQILSSINASDDEIHQFYAALSTKRFELAHKLYELSNICMFNIKLDLICRVCFHLRFSSVSNYNLKPNLFAQQALLNGRNVKGQMKDYKNLQRKQFFKAFSPVLQAQANKQAITLFSQNIDTEHYILELNRELTLADESLSRFWDNSRLHYVFGGLSYLMSYLLIRNFSLLHSKIVSPLGVKLVHRNVHALQSNLNNFLPTQHNLSIVTAFTQFYHHHPSYNDYNFARVREFTELMKLPSIAVLQSTVQQKQYRYTEQEYSTLIEIISNNQKEKDRLRMLLQNQRQLELSHEQARKWTSLELQQEQQRELLRQREFSIKQEQLSLEKLQRDRDAALAAGKKAQIVQTPVAPVVAPTVVKDSSSESSDDDDIPPPATNPMFDMSRWTTVDKNVQVQRKRGPLGQTTTTTTKTTVIKTGVGDAPATSASVPTNTTAALIASNQTGNPTRQITIKQAESPSGNVSPVSQNSASKGGFFDRWRKK